MAPMAAAPAARYTSRMIFRRIDFRIALQLALVSVAAYWCGLVCTGWVHQASREIGGLWALISAVVVLQDTRRLTWQSAWIRVRGTLIGACMAALCLSILPFSMPAMGATIFVTVLACHAAGLPDHARLASITVALIMVITHVDPNASPAINAALRFSESTLGAAMAVLVALAWPGAPPAAAVPPSAANVHQHAS